MNHTAFCHSVVLAFAFSRLHAQQPLDPPLRNWAAPLYWAPQPGEIRQQRAARQDGTGPPQAASIFTPPGPMTFIALTPCRVMDTRSNSDFTGAFGPPALPANGTPRQVPVPSSSCNVPSHAGAYSLNITVVSAGEVGFLSVWPAGQPFPGVSILNANAPGAIANAAIVPAGTGGAIQMLAGNPTDVIIDINGYYASPTDMSGNTTVGIGALVNNTTGSSNTASGDSALLRNTTGTSNTASGAFALLNNTTGTSNTATGAFSRQNNTTGSSNIAIGGSAASNVSGANSDNIHIGSTGAAADSGAIRIGTPGTQTSFFAAGVRDVTTANNDAIPVVIDSAGQLGTISSSRRFKEDIHDMGDASRGLMRLRPVTFRYQKPFADDSKPIQYGLIAEEVAEVYPDLVAHSADGQAETVKYQVLDSMLLNELQRLNKENQDLHERLSRLEAAMERMTGGDGLR